MLEAVFAAERFHPAGRFVKRLEGQLEGAMVHGNQPLRLEIVEGLDRLIGPHVDLAEGFWVVGPDGQQGQLGLEALADFMEPGEIGGIARVINRAPAVLQDEPAPAPVFISQGPGSPVLGRNEGHLPVVVAEAFPPFQFDDAAETQTLGQGRAAPGHHGDLRRGDLAQRRFVEMIEVRVGEQHEVDGRQIFYAEPGSLEALQQEEPVGEIGVDDGVEPLELH